MRYPASTRKDEWHHVVEEEIDREDNASSNLEGPRKERRQKDQHPDGVLRKPDEVETEDPEIAPEAPTSGTSEDEKNAAWNIVAAAPVSRYHTTNHTMPNRRSTLFP